ncbi:hypothetical protein HOC35_00875 [Candidatus Woesearchaeota archaeon]|jgi:hypothetical protein|nr:hypothetical protein [Candidatus Woesearchaeota archaeon]
MAKHKHSMYMVLIITLVILFGLMVVLDGCNTIVLEGMEEDLEEGEEVTVEDTEEIKAGDLVGQASRWNKQVKIREKIVRVNSVTNNAKRVYTEKQDHRIDKKPGILKFPPIKSINIMPIVIEGKPIEILVGKLGYCLKVNGVCSSTTIYPISGADVSVLLAGNEEIKQCVTNQFGKCIVYVEQGEMYKIVVNKEGYEEGMVIKSFPISTHPDKQKLNVLVEIEMTFWKKIPKTQVVITSNNQDTIFKDKSANYIAYQIPDTNFRVVCQQPCPIPENILRKKTAGAYFAINELLKLTQLDVREELKPVDIHLTSDIECGDYQEKLMTDGYVNNRFGIRPLDLGGSYMCLWDWENENQQMHLNPYYASQMGQDAEENALRLEAQLIIVHEYTHVLLSDFCFYTEAFAKAFSFYVSGYWDGNGYLSSNFPKIINTCDPNLNSGYTTNIYNQCTQCGFSYEDVSSFIHKMREIYLNGKGEGLVGKLTINQMMGIFEEITGDCNISWIQEVMSGC